MIEQVNPVDQEVSEVPVAVDLRREVKDRVSQQNGDIWERVVNHLTEVELERRANLLRDALDKRDELFKQMNKIKPDHLQYNADGVIVNEFYTKDQVRNRKTSIERFDKIDNAISKAVTAADYDGLQQTLEKLNKGGDNN